MQPHDKGPRKVRRVAPPERDPVPEELPLAEPEPSDKPVEYPSDWIKGQLLNVRNYGHAYIVTAYPEEFDQAKLDRAIQFTNPAECQDFISNWYQREHCDPRAR